MLRTVANGLGRNRWVPGPAARQALLYRRSRPDVLQSQKRLAQTATVQQEGARETQNRPHRERNDAFQSTTGFSTHTISKEECAPSIEPPSKLFHEGTIDDVYGSASTRNSDRDLNNALKDEDAAPDDVHRDPLGTSNLKQPKKGQNGPWKFGPALLIRKILNNDATAYPSMRLAASKRLSRIPIVLVQMLLHRERSKLPSDVVDSLPDGETWRRTLRDLEAAGYTKSDLLQYLNVLEGETDDEKCSRFLALSIPSPIFLIDHLIRPSAKFRKPDNLGRLIEHCLHHYSHSPALESGQLESANSDPRAPKITSVDNYTYFVTSLAHHCHRIDARFCIKVSELAGRFIEKQASIPGTTQRVFQRRCRILNVALKSMQPRRFGTGPILASSPNVYLWEAQRALLNLSATFEKPLLLDADAFRSIRTVLAGQPKNHEEVHSALRYAETWPPYLRPGDGVDEQTDPGENWSRVVKAGMMMQEAGFSLTESDDALNVLGGMSPDGAPTIQQRVLPRHNGEIDLWEACIRSTRNTWEAWRNFQKPPFPNSKPKVTHYAAMFEKLFLRESKGSERALPGDKSLNFSTKAEVNLTEHEKARLRPPTTKQLYDQMLSQGIQPKGRCLVILVANAPSVDAAEEYLRASSEDQDAVLSLMTDTEMSMASKLSPAVLAAYINVCVQKQHTPSLSSVQLQRAIRLTEICREAHPNFELSHIWGVILKNIAQHYRGMNISLGRQLKLLQKILDETIGSSRISHSILVQYAKCLRKVVRRELDHLLTDLASRDGGKKNPTMILYDRKHFGEQSTTGTVVHETNHGTETTETTETASLLLDAVARLKHEFYQLVGVEETSLDMLRNNEVPIHQVMLSRSDPVGPDHAHQYLLTLAYVGEFEEMAVFLQWLVRQWADPEFVRAGKGTGMVPTNEDFRNAVCVFRLLAEPMLDESVVVSVQDALRDSGLEWSWPDDDELEAYANGEAADGTVLTLERVLGWVRFRQSRKQTKA